MRAKTGFAIGCGCAALLLGACFAWLFANGTGASRSQAIGGNWVSESHVHSLRGDSSSQWLLLRKNPAILVEDRVLNVEYCGDDCVLYETSRKGYGVSVHYRAACGDRQPALFVPPGLSTWRIKDCGLQASQFVNHVEIFKDVISRDEIKKRAWAQPKASLKRRLFKLEYVDPTKDPAP